MEIKEDFAFKCDFCEKAFFTKQILLFHEKSVHESSSFKAKVFVCEMCSMSFAIKPMLKNHILTIFSNRHPGRNFIPTPGGVLVKWVGI